MWFKLYQNNEKVCEVLYNTKKKIKEFPKKELKIRCTNVYLILNTEEIEFLDELI